MTARCCAGGTAHVVVPLKLGNLEWNSTRLAHETESASPWSKRQNIARNFCCKHFRNIGTQRRIARNKTEIHDVLL